MPRSIWSFRKKLRDQGPNLIMVEKSLPSLFCKQHTLSFSVTKTFQLDLSGQIFVSLSRNWGKCTLLYTITYYFVHCLDLNAIFLTVTLYLSKLQCYLSRDKVGQKVDLGIYTFIVHSQKCHFYNNIVKYLQKVQIEHQTQKTKRNTPVDLFCLEQHVHFQVCLLQTQPPAAAQKCYNYRQLTYRTSRTSKT